MFKLYPKHPLLLDQLSEQILFFSLTSVQSTVQSNQIKFHARFLFSVGLTIQIIWLAYRLNCMAHSAVWGYLPIQRQNKNSKKLMQEKLSENGVSTFTKFGRAHLTD